MTYYYKIQLNERILAGYLDTLIKKTIFHVKVIIMKMKIKCICLYQKLLWCQICYNIGSLVCQEGNLEGRQGACKKKEQAFKKTLNYLISECY